METLQQVYDYGVELYGKKNPNEFLEFTDKGTNHSYIDTYQQLFNQYNNNLRLLEIGVQTGGSLWLWKTYLDNYDLWGVDILPSYYLNRPFVPELNADSKIHTFWNRDSTIPETYNDVLGQFDIISDDGNHHPDFQIKTFLACNHKLAPNGTYVIEDVLLDAIQYIKDTLISLQGPLDIDVHIGLKNGRYDDNIIKIKRK